MDLELDQYWTYGLALLIVLILIFILFWIIQRIGVGGGKGRRGSRLGIVEAAVVDRSRRLVLIRRDAIEHLVMIGGPQDVVVETNITKSEPTLSATANDRGTGGPDLGLRPGAQAAVTADPAPTEPKLVQPAAPPPPPRETEPMEPEPMVAQAMEPAPPPVIEPPHPAPVEEPAAAQLDAPSDAPGAAEPEPQRAEPQRPEPQGPAEPAEQPAAEAGDPDPRPDMVPRRPPEEGPRPAAPARPWPPSEGRFREAQRRFAERSDYNPPGRGGREDPASAPGPHGPQERQVANRAAPDGMRPPERPREVSQEGPTREPANLNVRPGEDR